MFYLQVYLEVDEDELSRISKYFRRFERDLSKLMDFRFKMGGLEREWISIKSELTVGIPMGLDHMKLIQKIQQKNPTIENARRLADTANQLTKEVVELQNQVRMFETKLSAVLPSDVTLKTEDQVKNFKMVEPTNKLNNVDNNNKNNNNNNKNEDYNDTFQKAKDIKFQEGLTEWKFHLVLLRRKLECQD